MASQVSRNDPCPCGSKKKYKNCHGKKRIRLNVGLFKKTVLAVIVLVAAAWGVNRYILVPDNSAVEKTAVSVFPGQQTNRVQPLIPQPPGPVPDGKVWSPEHGHWHNAPVTASGDRKLTPRPPGLAPPGKIWSPEHGHWHDSSYTGTENFKPGPPPPGPPPEGKVWSYEHGHWHDDQTTKKVEAGKDTKLEKIAVGNMDDELLEIIKKRTQKTETGSGQED